MKSFFEEFKEENVTHCETTDKKELEEYLALMGWGEYFDLSKMSADMVDLTGDSETGRFTIKFELTIEGNFKE